MDLSRNTKRFFVVLLVLLLPFFVARGVQATQLHGFWNSIWFWFEHNVDDPMLNFAQVDFLTLMLTVLVLIILDYKKRAHTKLQNILMIAAFPVWLYCPSYMTIIYILSREKSEIRAEK